MSQPSRICFFERRIRRRQIRNHLVDAGLDLKGRHGGAAFFGGSCHAEGGEGHDVGARRELSTLVARVRLSIGHGGGRSASGVSHAGVIDAEHAVAESAHRGAQSSGSPRRGQRAGNLRRGESARGVHRIASAKSTRVTVAKATAKGPV
jgi:hypothetical protein